MALTPTERDRLVLFTAAELARRRRARGLRLNVPEATALIADAVCEAARDGLRLEEAVSLGRAQLGPRDVLPGVADVVTEIRVEAVFDDGTRLVVVGDPFGAEKTGDDGPGAVLPAGEPPAIREAPVTLTVLNIGDVPVSVTSHFHSFEVNPCPARRPGGGLRHAARGARGRVGAVRAGGAGRSRPGAIGGARVAVGFAGLVDGPLDAPGVREEALLRAATRDYLGTGPESGRPEAAEDRP